MSYQYHIDGRMAGPIRKSWAEAANDAVRDGYAMVCPDGVHYYEHASVETVTTAVPLWPWNEPQDHCRLIRKHDGSHWWAPKDVEVPADFAVVVENRSFEHTVVLQAIAEDAARPASVSSGVVGAFVSIGIAALVALCLWILTR